MVIVPEGPGAAVRRGAGRNSVGVGLVGGLVSAGFAVVPGKGVAVAKAVGGVVVGVTAALWEVEVGCGLVGCG